MNSRISSSCERQVEPGLARVALTAGTTAQLVVDAARLVALGADDVEAAERRLTSSCSAATCALIRSTIVRPGGFVLLGVLDRVEALLAQLLVGEEVDRAAEHDVGASTGHVGGDGDRALVAGQRDDLGLVGVLLGVEDGVRDAALLQQAGEVLGLLDRDGADQDRLALLVPLGDVLDDGVVLRLLGAVDEVGAGRRAAIGLLVGIGTTPSL